MAISARLGNNPWIPPVEHSLLQLQIVYDEFTLRIKEIGETPYFTNVKLIDRDWSVNKDCVFVFMVLGETKSRDLIVILKGDLILTEDSERIIVGKLICRIKRGEIEITKKTTERLVG